jgi:general secretion pathway protein A
MYNAYFGFSESPFENNLNQRFLFLSDSHKEVLAALYYFIKDKKGLALVGGDVGTGKTMLINSFIALLPSQIHSITISNPHVSNLELVRFIAKDLGIAVQKENVLELIEKTKGALIAARQQGRDYLLIIDEAQVLSNENLEQIRLLSNIEIPEGKLLQILLVGQYEMSQKIDSDDMRQLRQRININRCLFPLTQAETFAYIDHRLQAAGSSFQARFAENCVKMVHDLTGGVPRNINLLCDNALFICMTEGLKKVNPQILKKAWKVLQTDSIWALQAPPTPWRRGLLWRSAVACLASLLLGFALGQSDLPRHLLAGRLDARSQPLARTTTNSETNLDLVSKKQTVALPQDHRVTAEEVSPQVPEPQPSVAPSPAMPSPEQTVALPQDHRVTAEEVSPQVPEPQPSVAPSPAMPSPEQAVALPQDHRVTAEDGNLSRIISKFYPNNKEVGLAAVLLANPQITSSDLIYVGQQLILPNIKNTGKIFRLPDAKYYVYYDQYIRDSPRQRALKRLQERQVRFVVREAQELGVKVYRIFLGGYDQETELHKAITLSAKS